MQCGTEFIHSLFSTDGSRKPAGSFSGAHDGNANIGGVGSGDSRFGVGGDSSITSFEKPDQLAPPPPSRVVDPWSSAPNSNSGDARIRSSSSLETTTLAPEVPTTTSSTGFPTLIPFSPDTWSPTVTRTPLAPSQGAGLETPAPLPMRIPEAPMESSGRGSSPPNPTPRRDGHRRRTTPDPRIIRPPESLVVIGDYDEDEPPSENAVVDSFQPLAPSTPSPFLSQTPPTTAGPLFPQTPPPAWAPPPAPSVVSNSGDVFARSRKEINSGAESEQQQSGTAAATLSGSSHEWKVSIIPRGQNTKPAGVNSIPNFTIDGKADERFNKFYRTIDKVINKLDLTNNNGDLHGREGEQQIRLEGNTKDLSVESSAVVIVPRTTVAPGVTNRVSTLEFRPLHFTAPPRSGGPQPSPPGIAPPSSSSSSSATCGVAPDFTPCVSNEIASKSLLECCKRKNLPAGCQQLCRYDITQAEIRAAMDRGQCGIFNVAPFLECASQGKDNSACCRHRGIVQKTGPQCEQFCRPAQGLSALGVQHIVCGNAVGDMLHCHHSGVRI